MPIFFKKSLPSLIGWLGLTLFCSLLAVNIAGADELNATQVEISRLQNASVRDLNQAAQELSAFYQNLPTTTTQLDRRDTLIALIDLDLRNDQLEKARVLNAELSILAAKSNDALTHAMALSFQADILSKDGKLQEAKVFIEQALALASKVKVNSVVSKVNTDAGYIYQDLGEFKIALTHLLNSLDTIDGEAEFDEMRRATSFNAISTLYLDMKDPDMAMDYISKSSKIAEKLDSKKLLMILEINRGNAYSDMHKLEEAWKSYLKVLELSRQLGDQASEEIALNNLSDVAFNRGQFAKCIQYATQTFNLATKKSDKALISSANVNLGLCHISMGSTQLGAKEFELGLAYMRSSGAKTDMELVLGQLASAYEKTGLFKEAYQAMLEQRTLMLDLFKADRDRSVAEMKAKFDAKEREKQIEVLEQKNRVQSVEIKNKSLQRMVFILAAIIAFVIAVTIFYLYRKVRETNRHLQEANVKLADQSTRDPLTGLLNRRAFHDMMQFRIQMTERRTSELQNLPPHALIIMDIDHFKLVNDNYGHAGGDMVLIEISKRLTHVMRDKDMLMRWGGEEFLIFLNHIPPDKLAQVVERILITVGGRPIELENQALDVTISAGYISLPPGEDSEVDANWEKSLNLADSALYMAKTRGRNRAIGIKTIQVSQHELDELLQGDLEHSIIMGKVTIQQIEGPVQHESTEEF